MKAYSINAIETLKGALKSVCENMPHSSDSKWLPPRTHDCSLGVGLSETELVGFYQFSSFRDRGYTATRAGLVKHWISFVASFH